MPLHHRPPANVLPVQKAACQADAQLGPRETENKEVRLQDMKRRNLHWHRGHQAIMDVLEQQAHVLFLLFRGTSVEDASLPVD